MVYDGKKEVTGVVLFFFAIILTLMFFLPSAITGAAGDFLRMVGFGALGKVALVIPFFLFYAAIDYFLEKREGVSPIRVRTVIIMLVCAASLFAAITMDFDFFRTACVDNATGEPKVTRAVSLLWKSGLESELITPNGDVMNVIPGGLLGGLIATGLEAVCGRVVTVIAIIAFTITQVILIFHISVKKTAKAIGHAARSGAANMRYSMARRGHPYEYGNGAARPQNYRPGMPGGAQGRPRRMPQGRPVPQGMPRPQRAVVPPQGRTVSQPVNPQSADAFSPFVMSVERDVPVINGDQFRNGYDAGEYDPFNVNGAKIPVDKETGFYDIAEHPEPTEGTITYNEKTVNIDEEENRADFSYNSNPHHEPYGLVTKKEYYDFKPKDDGRQKEFYDVTPEERAAEETVAAFDTAEYGDDEIPVGRYDDIEGGSEEQKPGPGVRTANVPVDQFDNVVRNVNVQEEAIENAPSLRGSNVATAMMTETQPVVPQAPVDPVDAEVPVTGSVDPAIRINDKEVNSGFDDNGRKLDLSVEHSTSDVSDGPKIPNRKEFKGEYRPAPTKFLETESKDTNPKNDQELREKAKKLEDTLRDFGIESKVERITHGPTITRFELTIQSGVKISKVTSLADDIQMAMAAVSVRIEAPIPGKSAIGIEIPNDHMSAVRLKKLLETEEFRKSGPLNVAIGRNIPGEPMYCNLAKMPHLLIAGSTGSGKSVCLNSMLISILCKASPDEVRLIMVDPKVVELSVYNGIPHLLMPVVTNPTKATNALKWAVIEMERRYALFAESAVRDLGGYNEYLKFNGEKPLPLILVIVDEFADLMIVAKKEIEEQVLRLAAKARAAGIHLILATQRPSVDVITGVLRNNLPSRIALAVTTGVDSRTILDQYGAEKLLGKGDMLYAPSSSPKPIRGQGAFVTDKEVETIVGFLKEKYGPWYDEQTMNMINNMTENTDTTAAGKAAAANSSDGDDDLLESAVDVILEAKVASVSILQRRLGIGYPRAGKLIDALEQKGYIGPFEGSKPRKVLIDPVEWLEIKSRK